MKKKGASGTDLSLNSGGRLRDRLHHIIGRFSSQRLVVVGDLISDQYLYGETSRVSREAPVLVLRYRNLVGRPGGAANAANNLLDFGARSHIIGVVGQDDPGKDLKRSLSLRGVDVRYVAKLKKYTTPVKTRILAGAPHSSPQQIVRLDRVSELESEAPGIPNITKEMFRSYHGIIVSDYGYGTVTPLVIQAAKIAARDQKIPIVVDSRFSMTRFEGVTSITPNISELEAALGTYIGTNQRQLDKVGLDIVRKQKLDCLLVTQGRFGMTLIVPQTAPLHIPIFGSDEVTDVTGAGDTVIAAFTLALASGAARADAARLANYAAGIVVMKRGTATAGQSELQAAIDQDLLN